MKIQLKQYIICTLILVASFACNNAKEVKSPFTLSGTLEGAKDGKVVLSNPYNSNLLTTEITDGKFEFKGNLPEPTMVYLKIEGEKEKNFFYVENAKMTFSGNITDLKNAKIEGSKTQDVSRKYSVESKALLKEYNDPFSGRTQTKSANQKVQSKTSMKKRLAEFQPNFIRDNPTSYFSAVLIKRFTVRSKVEEIEALIDLLDPIMEKNSIIIELRKHISEKKKIEIGIDKIIDASNVSYKVDKTFKGDKQKNIIYLSVSTDNKICALKYDGSVSIINSSGKELNSFKPKLNGKPSSIATDKDNNIYILTSLSKEATKKIRGRSVKIKKPIGVECLICSIKGEEISRFKLNDLKSATGARVCGDNLIVADYDSKKIVVLNSKTGKVNGSIPDMRPCCHILDFSVNKKNEILVANLGAFRVQSYDFTGKNIIAFGGRGKTINDFHGCCNPVSVASLSNGAIVTVEKEPTRIKVYSKDGAKQIEGIQELVKGCVYIPMIVDSNDNLYLASLKEGLVKCVSIR